MRAEKYMDEYLRDYDGRTEGFDGETGLLWYGAALLSRVRGYEKYSSFVERCVSPWVEEDGSVHFSGAKEPCARDMILGRLAFFLLDQTGDEKYLRAVKKLMGVLRSLPECSQEDLFAVMPFYMEYETRIGGKEKYGDIILGFDKTQKLLYNEKRGLCLMALVDTMDCMSFQIFEQYKHLEQIFRQELLKTLSFRNQESGLFCGLSEKGDAVGSLMAAYGILKACRMGIILREKYEHFGIEILEGVLEDGFAFSDKERKPSPGEAGIFMMAYSQYLQLKEETE